jgi:hypothetical protein
MDLIPWIPFPNGSTLESVSKLANRNHMTSVRMAALRSLAPESGAYFNECDTNEPDWRRAFFGGNYQRLLEVKRKYDPADVFWCRNCVGNDRWVEQQDGGLCKA